LNKSKKFYEIFLEMYMWVWEYPPNIISRETELDPKTVFARGKASFPD